MSKRALTIWTDADDATCGDCGRARYDHRADTWKCPVFGAALGFDVKANPRRFPRCPACLAAESRALARTGHLAPPERDSSGGHEL
jgi:hypothetical protein